VENRRATVVTEGATPPAKATLSPIRAVGFFLLSLLIAVVGTAAVETPLLVAIRPTMPDMLRMTYLLDVTVAFALGRSVYQRWRLPQWQWIGAAGVCWFVSGAFRLWVEGSPAVYREMSGIGCVYDMSVAGCTYYLLFTGISLRLTCYSAGAFCCLRAGSYLRRRSKSQ
jgi:hypothetical protein